MNIRKIANSATSKVNPNITIGWKKSTGYTINEDYEQVPYYETGTVRANVQAIEGDDLKLVDALNIQGTMRKVYLYENAQGVVRVDAKGGDLLIFPEVPGAPDRTWLVTHVMETWPNWSAVIVTLQND